MNVFLCGVIVVSLAILWWFAALGPGSLLLLPFLLLYTYFVGRILTFCEVCGAQVHGLLWSRIKNCPSCGAAL